MITRRLLRPAGSMASVSWTCASCTRASFFQSRRSLHRMAPMTYDETFTTQGVAHFLSSIGYGLAWTQYQTMIVTKLNELTAGEPIDNVKPKDLAIQFARDPMNASIFNHASMAHNNELFFRTLSPAPQSLDNCPQLQESLIKTFGSIETLRATMLDTADAMFGPGFVWLVWARNAGAASGINAARGGSWRILNTYLAGTPYSEAGYRQQGVDMNTNTAGSYGDYVSSQHLQPQNYAGAFGAHSTSGKAQARFPPGGTNVMPVLCVNTWEHAWIYDYGLLGKRRFLNEWWNVVDWGIVENLAPPESKQLAQFMRP